MTFKEKYNHEKTWHGRVMVMEIYHLTMTHRVKGWTLAKSADYFACSIGLLSENLKLAHALHQDPSFIKCVSRQDALKKLNGNGVRRGDDDDE